MITCNQLCKSKICRKYAKHNTNLKGFFVRRLTGLLVITIAAATVLLIFSEHKIISSFVQINELKCRSRNDGIERRRSSLRPWRALQAFQPN